MWTWLLFSTLLLGSSEKTSLDATCKEDRDTDWAAANDEMWECVERTTLSVAFAQRVKSLEGRDSPCVLGMETAATIVTSHLKGADALDAKPVPDHVDPFHLGMPLAQIVSAGFPIFGALQWLVTTHGWDAAPSVNQCDDQSSQEFRTFLKYHLEQGYAIPTLQTLEYVGEATVAGSCNLGRAAGLLALALTLAPQISLDESRRGELLDLVDRAEALLRSERYNGTDLLRRLGHEWPLWTLLHRLVRELSHRSVPKRSPGGCLLMVYTYPTSEIRADTEEALRALEKYYFKSLGVTYPVVMFTDAASASTLQDELGRFTSAPLVPAVVPIEELKRPMSSYSCFDGVHCETGGAKLSDAHRANVNKTQFWSPDYLRISRYTAGPLFQHPALDDCGAFIKVDTDFFLTSPLEHDPIADLQMDGSQLAYWQIHVQGQRQAGFMDAALEFLHERKLRIRSKAFYARGRFEEKAKKLGIPLSEVPEAAEAATVVYGCLFGGDVRFFREPLYQEFFEHMVAKQGFEKNGWSNQFFLGTAASAFLFPSQIKRLYISGRHQESKLDIFNGTVTEFLLGSMKSVLR